MKVLMPTIFYPHIGGITVHVENLVKNLEDIEFYLITYDYSKPKYKNIHIYNVPYLKRFRGVSYLINAYRVSKKIIDKEKIDIIHSHYAFPQGCLGGLLKKRYGIPHILTLHGSDALILKNSLLGKKFFNFAIENADEIICVSNYIKETVGRGRVIYNGVDREMLYNEGDHNFALFVGSFVKQKGVDILIKEIEDIDYNFILIGDGPLYKEVYNYISKKGLGHIMLLGKKKFNEVAYYMRKCSFLIVPSRSEGFGLTAIEAMACGKPVVARNVGGLREIVINNYNGFLTNNLKEKIELLINDKNLRETLGKNAYKFSKKFSWEKTAEEVRKVYEEIV
ncbi:group 1 glycosyl transferase [Methanocaldococcus villosus KIN24-T80]|uniref:Group 1 glycosyl transferase n=1 Tax=Methanocaldococcus villosus KIN24-T80 TaxID=1069083 RepID=N6V105_9EURY|nr:glycosyltransferase family 4 protein [Methanocaldococcus villosus]ENN95978.1 group 1 glycosyl transferase [Methanocaldococcus villosus KIN24-T80]